MKYCTIILLCSFFNVFAQGSQDGTAYVKKVDDFEISGTGDHSSWSQTDWITLSHQKKEGRQYESTVKLLYSNTGIYSLFYNQDNKITSTLENDFDNLWTEDVVEIFFWTDEDYNFYFEYELSPNNKELPIMVPNVEGDFLGWRPWQYSGNRLTRHKASVIKENGQVVAWVAEFFIPFELLKPMSNVPPQSGTKWRANMYRMDYDKGHSTWVWQPVKTNFHEFKSFGTLIFE